MSRLIRYGVPKLRFQKTRTAFRGGAHLGRCREWFQDNGASRDRECHEDAHPSLWHGTEDAREGLLAHEGEGGGGYRHGRDVAVLAVGRQAVEGGVRPAVVARSSVSRQGCRLPNFRDPLKSVTVTLCLEARLETERRCRVGS